MLMKRLFTVLMLVLPLSLQAQMQFGYMSYKTVMAEMPEYAQAKQSMAELKAKYDAEATRGEEEFQKKFVDFLKGLSPNHHAEEAGRTAVADGEWNSLQDEVAADTGTGRKGLDGGSEEETQQHHPRGGS